MEVILLANLGKIGNLGDTVNVKAGFGRNYLLPYGKAVPATKQNLAEFEARRAELEKMANETLGAAQARAQTLEGKEVTINVKAGEEGKLFGSVGIRDIADALTEAGTEVDKSEVRLPEGPLRNIGEYDIDVQLHSDVMVAVKVNLQPE